MEKTISFLSQIDTTWTLFLDRDGVINTRIIDGYVRTIDNFQFIKNVKEAFVVFRKLFGKIIVVTNQQGIGKGLMTDEELKIIHEYMNCELDNAIDAVYFAPHLALENHPNRKPHTGMALQAKIDFPEIDFRKSIMVGDSLSDVLFGQNAGMKTVFIAENPYNSIQADVYCMSLYDFAERLKSL